MLKDETPISYLPESTAWISVGNGAVMYFVFRPSFAATALKRSTSIPTAVLPSAARKSLGGYVVSIPTVMVPSDLMDDGTIAASCLSTVPPGVTATLLLPPDEPPPHAAT